MSLTKLPRCNKCYKICSALIYFAAPKLLNSEPIPANIQPMLDCIIRSQPLPAKYPANAFFQLTGPQITKANQRVPFGQKPCKMREIQLRLTYQHISSYETNTCLSRKSASHSSNHIPVLSYFEELVDLIIYSHEVGIAKPDRRIFEMTCERLGVQPAEMIFLDDHERPLVTARRLGIHAILFQNTAQAIADIEAVLHTYST